MGMSAFLCKKKEPTITCRLFAFILKYYPFKASAPPTISKISFVIAA